MLLSQILKKLIDSIKIQMKNGSKDETVGVITIPLASLTPNIVAVDIKSMVSFFLFFSTFWKLTSKKILV